MAGDAKRNGGGLFGMGKWFTSTKPLVLDTTTPAAPPGLSPSFRSPNPSSHNPYVQSYSPSGGGSPGLSPPGGANNPYFSHSPQGSFRPDQPFSPPQPQGPSPYGPQHSFHQVADPTGPYNSGQPPYPSNPQPQGPSPYGPQHSFHQAVDPTGPYNSGQPPYPSNPQPQGPSPLGPGHSFHQVADPTGPYTSGQPPYPPNQEWSGRITDEVDDASSGSAYNEIQVYKAQLPSSQQTCLLHGTLEVGIYQAKSLPNMDMFSEKVRQYTSKLKEVTGLGAPTVITSDPYTTVVLGTARVARTRVISNNVNPVWNEHFQIPVAHYVKDIVLDVKDQDVVGSQFIGKVRFQAAMVLNGGVVEGWHDLVGSSCKPGAQLQFTARYVPAEQNPIYTQGVGIDAHGVPHTYFPLRMGCRLTLYQDAHIYDNTLPPIPLEGGRTFVQARCWEEMCSAINDAKVLVYIAGWSVFDKITLVRDVNRPVVEGGSLTLGELLKKKASQGVRVLMLVWDDKTSHDILFVKTAGVMNTHDEETKKFFKHTGVRCILAPRYGAHKTTWFRQKVVGTLYSHHQKIAIVDTGGPSGPRRLTSFIGGLDLTGGRWDTPSHKLFASLHKEHKNDFRNKSWEYKPESGGPREPWHDWHCRIEGHASYDVVKNFEQRWRKASKRYDDELVDIDRRDGLLGPSNRAPLIGDRALFVSDENDPETWHVQVFRSIDSGSVKGFPTTVNEVQKENLVWGKSVAIDISIQMAYVKAIRSAQHFVYIENQYFLGSSYNWPKYNKAGANHIIPMELTLKICSKIRERERFAVYVVIPMWPEGIADSAPVQEILYFQSQTMQMMYSRIADTLRETGQSAHSQPTDYLNFYCLGNRETKQNDEPAPLNPPDKNSPHGRSQQSRRMMIYVHAKGMIVDDELVIMGSANINQRSMDGSRDTEIAMGGYQPQHTWACKKRHPRGQVFGYRMSLWAEHLAGLEPVFEQPESLECVQRVNYRADRNWETYAAPEVKDMREGHLIRYPLKVEQNGTLTHLPGFQTFPDVGGKIMGSNQQGIPDDLTA